VVTICAETPPPRCTAGYRAQVALSSFFLLSSDVFITLRYAVPTFVLQLADIWCYLRVYALTVRNKFIVVYFGSIAVTRYAMSLALSLAGPIRLFDLPQTPIPLDTLNTCLVIPQFRFKLVPNSLAIVFGEQTYSFQLLA